MSETVARKTPATGPGPALSPDLEENARGVLNQAEIDSLMRFDEPVRTGMERLIRSGLISYERLPMLEIIFDRLVRILSTSLRNFTSDNAEATIESISSFRLGDYLAAMPAHSILAVFRAEEWDNSGLLCLDANMIYNMIDLVLGGRHCQAPPPPETRPYTSIERGLVERLVNVILADFTTSFTPVSKVHFRFDRLETNPRFAVISRVSNAAMVARLRIDMEGRSGIIEILLPSATLEPVRDLLLQKFMGEKFGRDHIWESHLSDELWTTEVELEAVLDEQVVRLLSILELTPGAALPIRIELGSDVKLRCGGVPMFIGKLGAKKNTTGVDDNRAGHWPGAMNAYQWVLELVLSLLLGATLFYAIRLERNIGILRSDRVGLGEVLTAIRTALDDADRGIQALQNIADHSGRALTLEIQRAAQAQEDLRFLLDRLESVAAKVEATIKSGRAGTASLEDPKPAIQLPSKAERDLLKILRLSK